MRRFKIFSFHYFSYGELILMCFLITIKDKTIYTTSHIILFLKKTLTIKPIENLKKKYNKKNKSKKVFIFEI